MICTVHLDPRIDICPGVDQQLNILQAALQANRTVQLRRSYRHLEEVAVDVQCTPCLVVCVGGLLLGPRLHCQVDGLCSAFLLEGHVPALEVYVRLQVLRADSGRSMSAFLLSHMQEAEG